MGVGLRSCLTWRGGRESWPRGTGGVWGCRDGLDLGGGFVDVLLGENSSSVHSTLVICVRFRFWVLYYDYSLVRSVFKETGAGETGSEDMLASRSGRGAAGTPGTAPPRPAGFWVCGCVVSPEGQM